ncbi:hypothetical protein [Saccharibacillus sp. O23]|uniref:hypothetical protein n=1 Tax=Saccharibacillus sp. O23 TaxID=2009338 RepID=UPI0015C5834F|nr:hypothetical protein [Saccharibacillus sp. O23]
MIGKTGNPDRISEVNNWATIQAKIEETFINKKHHEIVCGSGRIEGLKAGRE